MYIFYYCSEAGPVAHERQGRDFRLARSSDRASLPWVAITAPRVAVIDVRLRQKLTETIFVLAHFHPFESPSIFKTIIKQSAKSTLFYYCSEAGIRTPIVWTKTRCPTIGRPPNIKLLIFNLLNFYSIR